MVLRELTRRSSTAGRVAVDIQIDAQQNVLAMSRPRSLRTRRHYQFARLDWAPTDKVQANISLINSPFRTEGPLRRGDLINNSGNPITVLPSSRRVRVGVMFFNYDQFDLLGGYTPSWQLARETP